MSKKVLTQDERALKFFFEMADYGEVKLVRRGAKVAALTELPELNSFSFIEVSLKNGERWTMKRNENGDDLKYVFNHSDPVGDLIGDIEVKPKSKDAEPAALTPVIPSVVVDPAEAAASVDRIRSELSGVVSSFCRIGYEFIQVRDKELYRAYDCKNVVEFAEKLFLLKKASMYNYIQVCERFSKPDENGKPTAELSPAFAEFSYTQLALMLRLPDEAAALATPDMTCKEIKALKAGTDGTGDEPDNKEPDECVDVVNIFERKLTASNLKQLAKILEQHIGREISVDVTIPMRNGEPVPVDEN